MVSEKTRQTTEMVNNSIKQSLQKTGTVSERDLSDLKDIANYAITTENDKDFALKLTKYVKNTAEWSINRGFSVVAMDDVYWKALKIEAPYLFDSYLLYLEKNREERSRFYSPKREQLNHIGLIQMLQDLEDDVIDIGGLSAPPGSQKTTSEKFFISWVIGRHPEDYNLFYSHSDDITRVFYDGVLDITTNHDEYTWSEIFPLVKFKSSDAKRQRINFDKYKPYSNLQCTSVGSKNAGKVRCNRYLCNDDLIGGIEEALNKNILDKLWDIYTVDARQRKMDGCKELHICTRWSVNDIIGRLQRLYGDNPRVRFIAVPDIDPETGKSNFDYKYNGFSVAFFNDIALAMDDVSYKCLYKNQPIEREGLLYHEDDLRRYLTLPVNEPDAILGICDTKNKGTDYLFLPCLLKYGDDYYLTDCICDNNSDYAVQYERCTDIIVNKKMQQCEFESNNGGDRVSFEVAKRVKEKHGRCNITEKYTTANKETKIIVNAAWIKAHVIFRDKSMYSAKDDYGRMMEFLLSYSVAGKNAHDDVPDGLASFALYATNGIAAPAQVINSPI